MPLGRCEQICDEIGIILGKYFKQIKKQPNIWIIPAASKISVNYLVISCEPMMDTGIAKSFHHLQCLKTNVTPNRLSSWNLAFLYILDGIIVCSTLLYSFWYTHNTHCNSFSSMDIYVWNSWCLQGFISVAPRIQSQTRSPQKSRMASRSCDAKIVKDHSQ